MSRFLAAYSNYISTLTDAPVEFGQASALTILGMTAIGRRWIDRGSGIRPNLFTMLVAGSSVDRKSTSVAAAMDILREVEPYRVGPKDFTAEGLTFHMRKRPTKTRNKMVLPLEEFGELLAVAKRGYGQTLTSTLCNLYDGNDFERFRSRKKSIIVEKPRLAILGGVSFGMLEKFSDPVDWATGFFSRMLFIQGSTRTKVMMNQPTKDRQAEALAIAKLVDLRNEIKATPKALSVLPSAENIYLQLAARMITADDPAISAYRERLLTSTWKIALIYQIDIDPQAPIGDSAMEKAVDFAFKVWVSFHVAYTRTSKSDRAKIANRVWRRISNAGPEGIQRRDLYRQAHLSVDEFLPAVEILKQLGVIESFNKNKSVFYRILETYFESGLNTQSET